MARAGDNQRGEFLRIPKAVRETPGVSWNAKAVACHLRFRQRGRETVSIGARRLGADLGMDKDTTLRAADEAERKGLLMVLNRHTRKPGQRFVYDARPVDRVGSVPNLKTLSGPECPQSPDASVPQVGTPECPEPGDTSVPQVGTRQEEVKKNGTRREKEDRLLSLAFPDGASEKQQAALFKPVREAVDAGVPYALLAHALVSKKTDGAPWERIDRAKAKARAIVEAANRKSTKHFEDLRHLVDYAQHGGNGLPAKVQVGAEDLRMIRVVRQCTTWPGPSNETSKPKESRR